MNPLSLGTGSWFPNGSSFPAVPTPQQYFGSQGMSPYGEVFSKMQAANPGDVTSLVYLCGGGYLPMEPSGSYNPLALGGGYNPGLHEIIAMQNDKIAKGLCPPFNQGSSAYEQQRLQALLQMYNAMCQAQSPNYGIPFLGTGTAGATGMMMPGMTTMPGTAAMPGMTMPGMAGVTGLLGQQPAAAALPGIGGLPAGYSLTQQPGMVCIGFILA